MPAVLIVDDDKHTRALLRTILTQDQRFARHKLEVVEAADGEEGLRLFDDKKPAIVITDVLMPKMDGFALAAALRSRPHGKDVGLIVVTGAYRDAGAAERVRDEFRGLYFAKPYQLADLAAALDKLLSNPGQRGSAMIAVPAPDEPLAGTLAETPLPRLLLDLWERRATGAVEIKRAGLEKRIDVVVGHPVSVSSNQRDETLGEFLVARATITPSQHQRALKRAHEFGEKLGEALVELGLLTSAQLVKALTQQARAKIVTALRWSDGEWSYRPNRDLLDRHKGNALDPGAVVLLGLKQTGHLDSAVKVVDAVGGRPLALTARGQKLRATIARAFGDKLLAALDKPASVATVLETWPDAAAVMQALEALLASGCVEPTVRDKDAPATQPPGKTIRAQTDPIGLAGLSRTAALRQQLLGKAATVPARPPAVPALGPSAAKRNATIVVGAVPPPPATAKERAPARISPPPPSPESRVLQMLDSLFAVDIGDAPAAGPDTPPGEPAVPTFIADGDESGMIEVEVFGEGAATPGSSLDDTRDLVLTEYLRVQGADHYEVLKVKASAGPDELKAAYEARQFDFSLERFAPFDLGPDHGKLEEIHSAYRGAIEALTDPGRRAEFDGKRGTGIDAAPALTGELAYHDGQKKLAEGDLSGAFVLLGKAVAEVPQAADYRAALAWAYFRKSEDGKRPAEVVLAEKGLREALAIDPDHALSHEYLGRVLVASGRHELAIAHLEKALLAFPPRLGALPALEDARAARQEWPALERQYRLLIHRTGDEDRAASVGLWLGLARLYRGPLGDENAALTALTAAAQLAPDDARVPAAVDELTRGKPEWWELRADALRSRWRLTPEDVEPPRELFRGAAAYDRHDQAFVVAALLSVSDPEFNEAGAYHRRHRPRFLARLVESRLSLAEQPSLRHPDDDPELAALFSLLEELANKVAPLSHADLSIHADDRKSESSLPADFARVRAWVAEVLGVPALPVYLRPDFDDQIHVGQPPDGPVLLCGAAALTSTDRVSLGFKLARTMTYLWPGRGVAAARPARRLRSMLLGCLAAGGLGTGATSVPLPPGDDLAAQSRAWLLGTPESRREDIRRVLQRVTGGRGSLNLSAWILGMERTADRVGLVVSADPAVAVRGAEGAGGSDAARDLVDWARSPEHLAVRLALGRNIDV